MFLVILSLASCSVATIAAAQNHTYDYIIVGGGLTGLVVANRLSEDSTKSVLVIENGYIDDSPQTSIPYLASGLNTGSMWPSLVSAPNPMLNDRVSAVRIADVVGGGSVVNGMMFDRGSDVDYDAWEELGNAGWGWKGLAPYFKKATKFAAPSEATAKNIGITYDADAYGNGPLNVSISSYMYPDYKPIFDAWRNESVALPREGFASPVGVFWTPNSVDNATAARCHARRAYYDPVQLRPNLKLLIGTHVDEILTKTEKGMVSATGVRMTSRNSSTTSEVFASREVILAAGGIFTPHLLMLSGIGPSDVLRAANVSVKVDNSAVGSNFQDHVAAYVAFNISNLAFPNLNTLATNATFNASAAEQYEKNRTGPWTTNRGYALAMLPLKNFSTKYEALASKVEAQNASAFLPERYAKSPTLSAGYLRQRSVLLKQYRNTDAAVGEITIQPRGLSATALQKPLSRGTITLNNTHPSAYPILQYNSFQNTIDSVILCELIRYNRKHWSSPSLTRYQPIENIPGAEYVTDEEIVAALLQKESLEPSFAHPSGGCAMMPEELGGCVDERLRVYGVGGLRVVDASVLPFIPAAHLQATMYAVVEKAADLIKGRA